MDRRRLQIKNKIEEISEEKNLLQLNLDRILDQVHICADIVNGSKKLKQKDCSLILKYELEILKKITEINYELECVLDESPLNQLNTTSLFEDYSSVALKLVESKTSVTLSTIENQSLDLPQESEISQVGPKIEILSGVTEQQELIKLSPDTEFSNIACASAQFPELSWLDNSNIETEIESNFSDTDVQILRDTLKKCSEKLGLNPECFSSMTDFYQKSSNCEKNCTSQIIQNGVDNTNLGLEDVNTIKLNDDCVDVLQTATCSNSNVVDITNGPLLDAVCNLDIKENGTEHLPGKSEPKKIYTADDSSSTDFSCVNGTENSSSEEYGTDEASSCLIPLVDEHSIIVGNIVDEGHSKTDTNIDVKSTDTTLVYTAIEKLNNAQLFDRQAEAVAKMLPIYKPDITLKPTEHRINNVFEANEKSKKKKNKKNKLKENEFYELKPKSAPEVGMECAFSYVESPNEFYIHLVDEESIHIDALTEQLNNAFDNTRCEYSSKEQAFNAIGTFCFSYAPTYKSWYRARVLDWELGTKSEDVVVYFVDYGDKRRICYRNLRKMTKEMSDIPMLAVRCHLALMYPPQSTHVNRLTEWPMATIDAMMELSGLLPHGDGERDKIFRIIYASREGDSMSIDMHNLRDSEEHTVGQILLDLGLAVQIIEDYDPEFAEVEYFLQDIDTLERADNINEAVMGYDPKDEARICRFTKSDGTCFKGKNCKLEHVPISKDGFTTDKVPVFTEAMYSLNLPTNGELVNILISGYKDVCNFFAQIIWKPHKEKDYLIDEDLYTLLADMNLPKTVRSYENFKVYPAIGEIVMVKHWSHKWLRAVVREQIMGNDDQSMEYQVFTVDFGEYVKVPLGDLRKIKPHFLQLPFQAVECYLHDFVAREDCDKSKAKKFFLKNLYYHNFVAQTMSDSLPLKLALKTFDGRDIGKTLAAEGFAAQRTCDKNPVNGCYLEVY